MSGVSFRRGRDPLGRLFAQLSSGRLAAGWRTAEGLLRSPVEPAVLESLLVTLERLCVPGAPVAEAFCAAIERRRLSGPGAKARPEGARDGGPTGQGAGPWPHFLRLFRHYRFGGEARGVHALARELLASKPPAWMRLLAGKALLHLGCAYPAADAEFKRVEAAEPLLWHASAYRAEIALCRSRPARAFRLMDGLLSRLKGLAREEALAWRGLLRLWRGEFPAALLDLAPAAQAGAPLANCWLGAALLRTGRPREARAALEAGLRQAPEDLEARVWLAELNWIEGRLTRARDELDRVLARERNYFWAAALKAVIAGEGKDTGAWAEAYGGIAPEFLSRCGAAPPPHESAEACRQLKRGLRAAPGMRRFDRYLYPLWLH